MNKEHTILISGKDSVIVAMSAMSMASAGMNVVIGSKNTERLEYDIDNIKPEVVLIWGVEDADGILGFIGKWNDRDVKPFFIVTTCYKGVYNALEDCLPNNAYAVLEPESMMFIKEIINKVTDEGDFPEIDQRFLGS